MAGTSKEIRPHGWSLSLLKLRAGGNAQPVRASRRFGYTIERTTPPSTRSAAPLVAEESVLAT